MSPLGRILLGLAIAAIGVIMVYKTDWALSMLGYNPWAERVFGGGGTRLFYKLVGTLLIIVGFIFVTNLFERLFGGFLMRIFGA